MKIAVIHHAADRQPRIAQYLIADFCRAFEVAGHRVVHLNTVSGFEPADLALLHVNVSVVPGDYVALAERYPATFNATITDIRKTRISQALLSEDPAYDGPVIVKSNLNHGGSPERFREFVLRRAELETQSASAVKRPEVTLDYPIFDSPGSIPPDLRSNPDLVVERFLPEREGALFFIRQSFFLGDRHATWRIGGASPIVRGDAIQEDYRIPTPPAISTYRQRLGLDYGKIDYVEHDGVQTVFDVNKTTGGAGTARETVALLAPGITASPLSMNTGEASDGNAN